MVGSRPVSPDERHCKSPSCGDHGQKSGQGSKSTTVICRVCRSTHTTDIDSACCISFQLKSVCVKCSINTPPARTRHYLIDFFLDNDGIHFPTTTSIFEPKSNTDSCEEYTDVLCHAKLYVLGDTYDIPSLCQLALHRLHATPNKLTPYQSCLNGIANLIRYIFSNTQSHDRIRSMLVLYYACIFEDASKHTDLALLRDEVPEFAACLVQWMS